MLTIIESILQPTTKQPGRYFVAGRVVGSAAPPAPVPAAGTVVGFGTAGADPTPGCAPIPAGGVAGVAPLGVAAGTVGGKAAAAAAGEFAVRVIRFNTTATSKKIPKMMLVAQVSTSPVFDPNAVFPPPPPNAFANPPPRPFWIRMIRMRNIDTITNNVMNKPRNKL
jgi:hypothetical protein